MGGPRNFACRFAAKDGGGGGGVTSDRGLI